jgi:hypothetical protein
MSRKGWRGVALTFGLHGELNALVDTVQGILQLVGSVWPDDKGVVHIAKPAEELVGAKSSTPSSKSSM